MLAPVFRIGLFFLRNNVNHSPALCDLFQSARFLEKVRIAGKIFSSVVAASGAWLPVHLDHRLVTLAH